MYPLTFHTGDGLEGLSELPPEQAVVKLQRQNARLRRKAEAAMALEQENATLKSQLHDMASQMVRRALLPFAAFGDHVCAYTFSLPSIIRHRMSSVLSSACPCCRPQKLLMKWQTKAPRLVPAALTRYSNGIFIAKLVSA